MSDVDVLVHFEQRAADALDVLAEEGYASRRPLTLGHQLDHHGVGASQPDGGQIDLHWQLNTALGLAGPPEHWCDDFWAEAGAFDLMGAPTHQLAPADLLLHVCVHGAGWASGARLRWVADAATVVARRGAVLDWDRLVDQARRRQAVLALRDTLGYLVEDFEVAVPSEVLRALRTSPTTRREQLAYDLATRPRPVPGRLGGLPITLGRFVGLTVHDPASVAAAKLPGYLGRSWKIDSPTQLPGRLASKTRQAWRRG